MLDTAKTAFHAVKSSFSLLVVLWLFNLITNLFSASLDQMNISNTIFDQLPAVYTLLPLALIFFLLSIFIQSGALGYIRDKLQFRDPGLQFFWSSGKRYFPSIFLSWILALIVLFVVGLAAVLIVSLWGTVPDSLISNLISWSSISVAAIVGIITIIIGLLAPYFIVIDDIKAVQGLRRGWHALRYNFGKVAAIVALWFIFTLFTGILMLIAGMFVENKVAAIIYTIVNPAFIAYVSIILMAIVMKICLRVTR